MKQSLVGALLSLLCVGATIAAPIANGRFESGKLDSWSIHGFATVVDSTFGVPMLQGHRSALIVSLQTGCAAQELPETWCIGHQTLPPQGPEIPGFPKSDIDFIDAEFPFGRPYVSPFGNYPFASFLSQQFTSGLGDALTFDAQVFMNDGWRGDVFFAILWRAATSQFYYYWLSPILMAGVEKAAPDATDFRIFGDPTEVVIPIPFQGDWTVSIGVGTSDDFLYSSALLVDDVRVKKVAEPGGMFAALPLLLALAIGAFRRGSVTAF